MNPTSIKFAFFGTPYVARDTLDILYTNGFVPSLIVTSPDAPKGRGLTLTPSETKTWAQEHTVPVLTPEKLDTEALEAIRAYGCTYGVAVAYGKIFPQSLIDVFPKGVLNVHYSLLPKYRGASPVEAALLHGDTVTGVAVQKMARGLDTGELVAVEEVAILSSETTKELRPRLITLGAELLVRILPTYLSGELTPVPQSEIGASSVHKIPKSEGELSLSAPALENWNKYRAYAESPGTYFFIEQNGKRVRMKVTQASLSKDGRFVVERVIPEGKNETNYADVSKN